MSRVRIRAARPSDQADVAAICAAIWQEADDYVPQTWDDWLADRHGELVAAEWEGRVVGLAKLTHLTEEQWWLEGLRVTPEHRSSCPTTFHRARESGTAGSGGRV